MPLPTPKPEEKESAFIERCMLFQDEEGKLDLKDDKQRKQALAMCYSQYRRKTESAGPKNMAEILREGV